MRMLGHELQQAFLVHQQEFRIIGGHGRRGARTAIEHRYIPKDVTAGALPQDDLFAFEVLDVDLHGARTDDVKGVASVAGVKDRIAFIEAARLENLAEGSTLAR